MPQRLQILYNTVIVPKLQKELGYTNIHQVPRLEKIVINRGLGEASQNAKALESSIAEISAITGQRPVITRFARACRLA
jgi:large subunit ribosomal protein L5